MTEYLDIRCVKCGHTRREHASAALGLICMVGRVGHRQMAYGGPCACAGFEEAA